MKTTAKILLPIVFLGGCLEIPGVTSGIPGVPGGAPMMDRHTVYEEDTPTEEGLPEDGPDMSALLAQMGQKIQAPALSVDPEDLVVGRSATWKSGDTFFTIACVAARGLNKVVEYRMGAQGSDSMGYIFYMNSSGKPVKAYVVLPGMAPMEAQIMGTEGIPAEAAASPPPGAKVTRDKVTLAGRTFDAILYESDDARVWVSNDVYFWPLLKTEAGGTVMELTEMKDNARPSMSIP